MLRSHFRGGRTQRRSVTEMMRLFSAAQQRRVNVVTCILVHRYKATSQEGVMSLHLWLYPFSNFFYVFVILDCNSLLLTIQFFRCIDTRSTECDSEVAFSHSSDSVP